MKNLRIRVITAILSFSMICTCMGASATTAEAVSQEVNQLESYRANIGDCSEWKNKAIVYPESGQLVAAGPIYLQWKKLNNAKKYDVYIDGNFEGSVNDLNQDVIEYEVYSTSVAKHTVKIVAELDSGEKITANIRTFFISKKGMGSGMIDRVEDSGLSWYYHWTTTPVENTNSKLQFVPMLWGNGGYVNDWLSNSDNKKYKTILGFNEPDFWDQSRVSVDEAIAAWPYFMNKGLRVGAPATGVAAPWSDWFSSFMNKIEENPDLDVDFIPVHCYFDGPYADTFIQMIDDCYAKYHKPIWVTEFGIAEWWQGKWNGNDPEAVRQVSEFMEKVVTELDKRDFVERYAWFPFDPTDKYGGASGLYDVNTGKLNSLGHLYRNLGNPDGYVLPNLDGSYNSADIPKDEVVIDDNEAIEPDDNIKIKIESEDYTDMNGIETEECNDDNGGKNVGWIDDGDWMEYKINVPKDGNYKLNIRVKGWNSTGSVRVFANNDLIGDANVNTNNEWNTISINEFQLKKGANTIRVISVNGGFNLNWYELECEKESENDGIPSEDKNLALNKNTETSSQEGEYNGALAVDGKFDTRWASLWEDNQWISVDLGASKSISKVNLNWEAAYAKGYKIQVSNDGSDWNTVADITDSDGGKDEIIFDTITARYIRLYATERATGYGISLFDFEIYK